MVAPVIPPVAERQSEDEVLNRVQDRVKGSFDALVKLPFLNGALLEDVVLTSGAFTAVNHRLGRPWSGYVVFARNANAVLWHQAPAADANIFVYLQPSANVTVDLWVF